MVKGTVKGDSVERTVGPGGGQERSRAGSSPAPGCRRGGGRSSEGLGVCLIAQRLVRDKIICALGVEGLLQRVTPGTLAP